MKTIKLAQVFLAFIVLIMITSCVNDDDFAIPDLTITEPELDGEVITVSALKSLVDQQAVRVVSDLGFDEDDFQYEGLLEIARQDIAIDFTDSTQYVEGYVVSSDEFGNWFEEIIIQDSSENPTAGIRILIDESPLFTFYEVGRKVFVKLGGLHLGDSNGVLSLGVTENFEKIPAPLQLEFIQRSTIVETIVPVQTTIIDFNEDLENIFVQLTDVQFAKDEVIDASLTFAGEPSDEFDGERTIVSCDTQLTAILSTSTFADFKSQVLPAGSVTISGVLTRDFFGETFNIVVNNISDVAFEDGTRCDLSEVSCGIASMVGNTVLFEDDFETQSSNNAISGNGWTNFIEEGTVAWEIFSSSSANASIGISASIGSFRSDDDLSIAWLITPEIDFATQEGETLEFLTSNSFADGSTLAVLYSSDWDGTTTTIASATWEIVSDATIVDDEDFFADWIPSDTVDLSCLEASGHIAFKYTGSGDADFDGTYELEGIQINAN